MTKFLQIKYITRLCALLLWTFMIVSCYNEGIEPDNLNNKLANANITIVLPTSMSSTSTYANVQNGSFDENRVEWLRIELIDASNSAIWTKNCVKNVHYTVVNPGNVTNPSGDAAHPKYDADIINLSLESVDESILQNTKEIRAFANVTSADYPTTEPSALMELPSSSVDYPSFVIESGNYAKMSGRSVLNETGGVYSTTIELRRNIAKYRVKVIKDPTCNPSDLMIDYANIKVQTLNVPNKSPYRSWTVLSESTSFKTLAAMTANGMSFGDYPERAARLSKNPAVPSELLELQNGAFCDSAYINPQNRTAADYLANGKTTACRITIPTIRNGVTRTNTYTIPILSNNSTSNDILPNCIYTLKLSVLGQGTDDVRTSIEVLPWNVTAQNVLVSTITVSEDVAVMDYEPLGFSFDKLIECSSKEPIQVSYNTLPAWLSIDASAVQGQTSGNLKLTYTPTSNLTDDHSDFIIKLSNDYFEKQITVKYDNGYIPNSFLTTSGWTSEKLPVDGGLQIAKIGNKYPNDQAETSWGNEMLQWSSVSTSVTDVIETEYGYGLNNTVLLANAATSGSFSVPAVTKCQSLTGNWYLPSDKELSAIYDNRVLLGNSYTYYNGNSWSSTQDSGNPSNALVTNFATGTTSVSTDKMLTTVSARCVKNSYYVFSPLYMPDPGLRGYLLENGYIHDVTVSGDSTFVKLTVEGILAKTLNMNRVDNSCNVIGNSIKIGGIHQLQATNSCTIDTKYTLNPTDVNTTLWAPVKDLTGIEAFVNLKNLYLNGNEIEEADLSKNTQLEHLEMENNKLTTLKVDNNKYLTYIDVVNNQFETMFDTSHCGTLANPLRVCLVTGKVKPGLGANASVISGYSGNGVFMVNGSIAAPGNIINEGAWEIQSW